MSDRQPQPVAIPVTSFDGSVSSNDGESIGISLTASSGEKADLIVPVARAVDLMALASDALGKAAQKRSKDVDQLYFLPTTKFRVYETQERQTLILSSFYWGVLKCASELTRMRLRECTRR